MGDKSLFDCMTRIYAASMNQPFPDDIQGLKCFLWKSKTAVYVGTTTEDIQKTLEPAVQSAVNFLQIEELKNLTTPAFISDEENKIAWVTAHFLSNDLQYTSDDGKCKRLFPS